MNSLGLKHITFAPGFNSETHPNGLTTLTDTEWIDAFYSSYSVWVLSYAERLVTDGNAGFAILLILYPYFQMISRCKQGGTTNHFDEFSEGIKDVFKAELQVAEDSVQTQVAKHLYDNMRCEMAHGNLTGKGIALSDDNTPPIWWGFDNNDNVNAVGVNPRKWVIEVRRHFDKYREMLLDPNETKRREDFFRYTKHS